MAKATVSPARALAAVRAEKVTRLLDECRDAKKFRRALGALGVDGRIVLALVDAALGGDVGAMRFWLVNRLPEAFRTSGNPRHQLATEEPAGEERASSPFEGLKIVG